MCRVLFLTIIILVADCSAGQRKIEMAEYRSKVKFHLGKQIHFPDFSIEFVGTRKTPGPGNAAWTITEYLFVLKKDHSEKQIWWSMGTGDVGPIQFEFLGKNYYLEMYYSEKIATSFQKKRRLSDNEIVITKAE